MVILIVALMLLAESAQAQREPYYVHPSKSVYYYGNRLKWIIHAYVNLPYGGYLWIENSDTGDIWHWHIRPLRAGTYAYYPTWEGSGYADVALTGYWLMYFRGNDQDYVSSSSFEVSGIVYYENVTAAQTFTEQGTEQTFTGEETIMVFAAAQESTVTTTMITTAVATSTVETQRTDMTSLMSTAIVAVVAGLAVGLVIGRRSKAKEKSGN